MEIFFQEDGVQPKAASTPGVLPVYVSGSAQYNFPLSSSYATPLVTSYSYGMGAVTWLRGCQVKLITQAENSGELFSEASNYVILRLKLSSLAGFKSSSFRLEAVKTFRIPSGNSVQKNSQQFYSHAVFGNATEGGCRTLDILIPRKDIYGSELKSDANRLTLYFTVRVQEQS